MLIRSTPHACFVMLKNGLTLELFYDTELTSNGDAKAPAPAIKRDLPPASQGVWLMGESVLFEVRAGRA
jgi:hypothetical protein